jgi:hypothetical protein
MMPGFIKPISRMIMLLLISLTACTGSTVKPAVNESTQTSNATPIAFSLATPYAQQPAAGICASFDSTAITVTINIDIPDPRCSRVNPYQTLTVINNTQNPLQVTLGRFIADIEPGEKTIFDTPFGEYLAPGVHQLQVSPCCGAELWLEATK